MPEAPEVQTVLSTLETQIKDVSIEDVLIYYPKIVDNVEVETFKHRLIGQSFRTFNRLGKYLIFGLDDYDLVVQSNNSDYLQKARKYGHFTGYKN